MSSTIPPVSARTRTLPPRESRYSLLPVQRVYECHRTVNPLRYSSLRTLTEVHGTSISSCRVNHCPSHWFSDIGEVWANILHNVYAALVTAHGFSTTARTNPAGTEGNIVFLHLFIDALALQPCNPTCESPTTSSVPVHYLNTTTTVLTARTAWIQADTNRYAGANTCTLWRAFASRGLGTAAANHVDSTTVPAGC